MRPVDEYKKHLIEQGHSRIDATEMASKFRYLWVFYARKEGMTLSKIGKCLGLSKERVRQIYWGAIRRSCRRGISPIEVFGKNINIAHASSFIETKIKIDPQPEDTLVPERAQRKISQ